VFMSLVLGEDIEETGVPRGEPSWLLLVSLNLAPKPLLRGVLAGATLVNETEIYERDNYSQSNLLVMATVSGPPPINTMCSTDSRNIWIPPSSFPSLKKMSVSTPLTETNLLAKGTGGAEFLYFGESKTHLKEATGLLAGVDPLTLISFIIETQTSISRLNVASSSLQFAAMAVR